MGSAHLSVILKTMFWKFTSFLVISVTAFPFPEECGITYIEPDNVENTFKGAGNGSRIVGGFEAVPGSLPWQAYLIYDGYFTCGGTLISNQWVLSAGHCFFGGEDPKDWTIVLGEFDDSRIEGYEVYNAVEKVIMHPRYDADFIDFDFTLVKLAAPVDFNDRIAPACFPSAGADLVNDFPPGQVCITSGWGSIDTDGTQYGSTLKQEYAELWSNEECASQNAYPGWITYNMICAGFHLYGNEDPERCATLGFGDSGGPLVCRDADGHWTHLGATSWGSFCEQNSYTPGVFANTINLRQWLVDTLEANE